MDGKPLIHHRFYNSSNFRKVGEPDEIIFILKYILVPD